MKNELDIAKLEHDLLGATHSIALVIQMIKDGTINNSNTTLLDEAINKVDSLSNLHLEMIKHLKLKNKN